MYINKIDNNISSYKRNFFLILLKIFETLNNNYMLKQNNKL